MRRSDWQRQAQNRWPLRYTVSNKASILAMQMHKSVQCCAEGLKKRGCGKSQTPSSSWCFYCRNLLFLLEIQSTFLKFPVHLLVCCVHPHMHRIHPVVEMMVEREPFGLAHAGGGYGCNRFVLRRIRFLSLRGCFAEEGR